MKTAHLLRKITQLSFLFLFLYLISRNRYPLNFPLPTDFFLRIDPLSALSVITAGREIALRFWPSLITLLSAFILGRFFCGWVCPLGTTLDLFDKILKQPKVEKKIPQFHYLKFLILILVLVGAVFSFQFIFFLDPMVIITRTTTISILPITYYLLEGILYNLSGAPVLGSAFFDLYTSVKGVVVPVQEQLFRQNLPILLIFITIILLEKFSKRFWCRYLCPLGAMLGFIGKFSPFGRTVDDSCSDCTLCSLKCKMGTIKKDYTSSRAECIQCLNCYFVCPETSIHFSFTKSPRLQSKIDVNRRRFVLASASGLTLMGLYRTSLTDKNLSEKAIRPPGARDEPKFLDLCLRCQQCTGICSTTGACLQPAVNEAGLEGLWTPVADMRKGYCEYNCTLCGEVCPSGAIEPLAIEDKKNFIMGLAIFDVSRCIPYYKGEDCLVCEEHCPTPDKAIKFNLVEISKEGETKVVKIPYVDENLCIGCGICENKCPVEGRAGIFTTNAKSRNEQKPYDSIYG